MSMDARTTKIKIRRLLRLGVSDGTNSPDAGMGELEMELTLLREENARLKVERHRAPDTGRVLERMRHLGDAIDGEAHNGNGNGNGNGDGSRARETAEVIVECIAIRDALIQACHDVQQAMEGIRDRLGGLATDAMAPAGESSAPPISPSASAQADLELALSTTTPTDLSQSAA
jgi:hypothetical protein